MTFYNFDNPDIYDNHENCWQFWQQKENNSNKDNDKDNPGTCDIWDTDYNSDNWEPEFMTIFVTWQLRVTLDSIRKMFNWCPSKSVRLQSNSHQQSYKCQLALRIFRGQQLKHCKNCKCCPRHPLYKGHNAILNIVVLNCQKCKQCLKCQVSGHRTPHCWKTLP